MGQKVNPYGLRLGVNKGWKSNWFPSTSEDNAKYLNHDVKIRKYLEEKLKDAAVSCVVIERTTKKTDVIIHTAKPGVVIGHGGDEIDKIKNALTKLVDENIQIAIMEVKQPDLDAALVAENIAHQLENRVSFRMAQKRAIRNTMKAGAKGIKTAVSGRLGGADMARTEGYTEGMIPLHTLRADVDYAHKEANTTYGKIGVKVWIYKGEILPSKAEKGGNNDGSHTKKN